MVAPYTPRLQPEPCLVRLVAVRQSDGHHFAWPYRGDPATAPAFLWRAVGSAFGDPAGFRAEGWRRASQTAPWGLDHDLTAALEAGRPAPAVGS